MVWMKRHLLRGLILAFLLGPLLDGAAILSVSAAALPPIGCPGGPAGPLPPTANYPCPDGGQVINGIYYPPNTGRIILTVTYKDGSQVGHCPNAMVNIRRTAGANVGPASVTTTSSGGQVITGLGPGQVALIVNECIGDNNGETYHGESPVLTIEAGKSISHTLTLTAGGPAEVTATCEAGGFTWLLCPVIKTAQQGIMWFQGVVANLLFVQPLNDKNAEGKALKILWGGVRNIANVFFVLIFFVVIFGTAIGIDNYTIKKMLPRLIAAAVLIQFSYLLMGFAIDLSNITGAGIKTLGALVPGASKGNDFGVGEWAAGIGLLSLGVTVVIAAELIVPVLLVIISALLSFLTIWIALEFRHILIDFLVVLAPIAIVLWTLPNTKKFADKWGELFGGLLMIQPIIVGVFVVANLLSSVIAQSSNSITATLTASIMPIIAGFSVGALVANGPKWFTKGVGMIGGFTGKGQKGLENFGKRKAEERQERGLQKLGRLGGTQAGLKGVIARQQAGFGFSLRGPKSGTPMARRMESAVDKAATDRANSEALTQLRTQHGEEPFENVVAKRREAAMDKILQGRVAESSLQNFTYIDSATGQRVTARIGNVELNTDARDALRSIALNENETSATRIAAMQSLSRSAGGRDILAKMRTENFGGTRTEKVGLQYADLWKYGTANVKPDASPDLVKGPLASFIGVSGSALAAMDPATKARYLEYTATANDGGKLLSEASVAIREIASNSRLRSQLGKDDWDKMHDVITRQSATGQPEHPEFAQRPEIIQTITQYKNQYETTPPAAGPAAPPPTAPAPGYTPPSAPTAPVTSPAPSTPTGPVNVTINVPRNPSTLDSPTTPTTWQQRPSGLVIPGQPPAPGTTFHPAVDSVVEGAQDDTQDPRAIN